MTKIRTCDAIPEPETMDWCRRIGAGEKWTFTFYSLRPYVVYVHWYSGRTISCTEPLSSCRGHQLGASSKVLAYLHGYNHEKARDEFLELAQGAGYKFMKELGSDHLRGSRAAFRRGNGKTAHVHFEMLARHEQVARTEKLPPPETPEKRLRKLWGLNESHLKIHEITDIPNANVA